MNGLLATNRANLSFSDRPRHNRPAKPLPRRQSFLLEPLESRLLLSVTPTFLGTPSLVAGADVDVNQQTGNQREQAIAINPTNPSQLFVYSNREAAGDMATRSTDAGVTWVGSNGADKIVADGNDTLAVTNGDPSVAWDNFGNLFIAYLVPGAIQVNLSTDGGATINALATLTTGGGGRDQETIVAGAGSVWVTWRQSGNVQVAGASVTGLGTVGAFSAPVAVPGSGAGSFGDIAIGPSGQVLVTYQDNLGGQGLSNIFVNLDADGLGANVFAAAVTATTTNVGGTDFIPPQSNSAGIDAEAGLAYDLDPASPFFGRVYLVYTDEAPDESNDTDIFVRFSDDDGANGSWSDPVRVNDVTTRSQFLPRIAVDPTTGFVGVSWHDSRNDAGTGGTGDTDNVPNTDAQLFASVSLDGGATFIPNIQVSDGTSRSAASEPPAAGFRALGYGDYAGLTFFGGSLYPAWADNSNSTGNNPDGALSRMDIYTDRVVLSAGSEIVNMFGDQDVFGEDDTFKIALDPSGTFIQFFENGTLEFTATLSVVTQINVFGFAGNDTLIVDSSNGLISVANGIRYDGDGGFDALQLLQTGGSPVGISDTYSVGLANGSGKSVIEGSTETQTVFFENLSPVLDLVPAASLTVNATPEDNAINYTAGAPNDGLVTVDNFEPIKFKNKTNLIINALAGSDTINLHYNNTVNPVGLTGTITVDGADPTGSDTLVVNGIDGELDNLRYIPTAVGAGTVVNNSQPQPSVNFTGIEHLTEVIQQADGDGVRLEGTTGNDAIEFFHGLTSDSGMFVGTMDQNNVTGFGPFTMTPVNFTGASPVANDTDVNFFNPGGTDSFAFNGTTNDDTIAVGTGEGGGIEFSNTLNGVVVSRLEVFNVASFLVRALAGNDIINVTVPSLPAAATLRVEGGDGVDRVNLVGAAGDIIVHGSDISLGTKTIETNGIENISLDASANVGDRIIYNGVSGVTEIITVRASSIAGSGQISGPGVTLINFSNVESIVVNGNATETDTLTFEGTNAVDTFDINLAAVGTGGDPILKLQNENGTKTLLTLENYTNFNTLRVLGLDGADTFNVLTAASTTPADPNFDGRNLFVDGGQPTGKKKSTDNLNIFYTLPRPKIIQSAATQDPDAGLVDLDYNTARFVVEYDDIEQVRVLKK
jgi:hypothetical protein